MSIRSELTRLLGVLIFLGAWEWVAWVSDTRMFPGVIDIFVRLGDLLASGVIFMPAASTLGMGLVGLLIALVMGSVFGIFCARNRYFNAAVHPIISAAYPIPKLALYPIVILIFGLGAWSKIVQVSLECFFPIFVQVYAGSRALPKSFLWLAKNNQTTFWVFLKDVLLPSLLPFILTGLRIGVPIMLIVMTVTEFIGDSTGLGYLILRYSSYFDPTSAFAVIVVLGLLGLMGDRLIVWCRRKVIFWEKQISL